MKFLLDTNAIIALFKGHQSLLTRLHEYQPDDVGVSAVVMHELFYGVFRGQHASDNLARVDALRFEVVAFDREDARQAGAVRAHLAAAGTLIGTYDVLIAGQALARSLTLVTHNTTEFARVPELQLEDWE